MKLLKLLNNGGADEGDISGCAASGRSAGGAGIATNYYRRWQ